MTLTTIHNAGKVLCSLIFLCIRKIMGCKVKFTAIALVSPLARINERKMANIKIGCKVAIESNSEVHAFGNAQIIIGDNCYINHNCMIVSNQMIIIGNHVSIGPNVCVYDHDHDGKGGFVSKPIVIQDNVWIGAGSIILKGVTIGENSVIAAGSIVTKDVAANTKLIQKRTVLNCEE